MNHADLLAQHCIPRKGAEAGIAKSDIEALLTRLPGWSVTENQREIHKEFRFSNFHRTIGFVNAVAWIANREDHHPDMEVGYNYCRMRWSTHDVGGLSLNDFICAAKVEALGHAS